jgi:hypothetical protein
MKSILIHGLLLGYMEDIVYSGRVESLPDLS